MNELNFLKNSYNISDKVLKIYKDTENEIKDDLKYIDQIGTYNSLKVLKAFQNHNVSETYFGATTGYGYDDIGRDTLDEVYAEVFGGEMGLVRHSIANGTHAIALCLYGVLRPGDTLVALTGKPYDTLEEVIGLRGEDGNGSLKDFGINYKQVDLIDNSYVDYEGIKKNSL